MATVALSCFSIAQEIVKENLGVTINTSYAETKPVISPDGKTLFFARQFYPDNINGEKDAQDIYFSQKIDGVWSKSLNMGAPMNDRYPNGVSSISPDGNMILVLNAYDNGNVKNCASIAHKEGNFWGAPKKITIRNFYNSSAYVDYFISNNEQQLLLTIERDDAFGDQDIYVCFRMNESLWTEPVNLGPVINTQMAEFSPFLAADNKTLFFASQGHGSYGGSDIFYAKRLDDTWQNWTDPVNLGSDINSDGFEGYYTIPASGEYAYFVSDKGGIEDSKDIFRATIPYRFLPEPVVLMSGHVINRITHEHVEASIYYEAIENEKEMGEAVSKKEDGSYKIVLPRGFTYRYYAQVDGFFGVPALMDEIDNNEYQEIESNLYLIPIATDNVIPVFDIYFSEITDKILPNSVPELERIVKMLNDNPRIKIEVTAFTNKHDSSQHNLELSNKRAESICNYLISNNIPAQRLQPNGLGSKKFVDDYIKVSKEIDTMNRIEIKILATNWKMPPVESKVDSVAKSSN